MSLKPLPPEVAALAERAQRLKDNVQLLVKSYALSSNDMVAALKAGDFDTADTHRLALHDLIDRQFDTGVALFILNKEFTEINDGLWNKD